MKQSPENLGKPDIETGLRAKGWSRKKISELEPLFEKLSEDEIEKLLSIFEIHFFGGIKDISKTEILWTIADDWTYEQIKRELEKLKASK